MLRLILAAAIALVAAPLPAAQPGARSPAAGSAERRVILDALRPMIQRELRSPVEFVVRQLRLQSGWAIVVADPQRPGGGAIDGRHLPNFEDRDGLTVYAVLRLAGGRWRIHDHVIGPTDMWFCGMAGPPASLLPC